MKSSPEPVAEVVSVIRRRDDPFLAFPARARVRALDDQRPGARRPPAARLLARLPSLLVHPEDFAYPWASLRTDLKLLRRFRVMQGGVVIGTRPGFNVGSGIGFPLAGFSALGEIRLHVMLADGKPVLALPLSVGVRF